MSYRQNERMITATKYNTPDLYLRIWLMASTWGSFIINTIIMIFFTKGDILFGKERFDNVLMFVLMIFFGLLFFCFSFYQSKYSVRWDRAIIDVIFGFFCHGIIVSKIPQVLLFITIELLVIIIISIQIKKDDTWVDGLYIVEQYRKWKREREKRYIERQMAKWTSKKEHEKKQVENKSPNLNKMSRKKRKEYLLKLERQKSEKTRK